MSSKDEPKKPFSMSLVKKGKPTVPSSRGHGAGRATRTLFSEPDGVDKDAWRDSERVKERAVERAMRGGGDTSEQHSFGSPLLIPVPRPPWQKAADLAEAVAPGRASGRISANPAAVAAVNQAERASTNDGEKSKSIDQLAAEAIVRESREAQSEITAPSEGIGWTLGKTISMITRAGENKEDGRAGGRKRVGLLEQNMIPGIGDVEGEDAKFKHDLGYRAEDFTARSKAYEDIPVSEFGAALLRGMGWQGPEGDGEGAGRVQDYVKDVEPRHHRLGLGAQPKPPEDMKKKYKRKPGEKPRASDEARLKIWEERARQERVQASRQGVPGLSVMNIVTVPVEGNEGRTPDRAMVLKTQGVPGLNKITVRMEHTGEKVDVDRGLVSKVPEDELAREPFADAKLSSETGSRSTGRKRNRDRSPSPTADRSEDDGRYGSIGKGKRSKEKKRHKESSKRERDRLASSPEKVRNDSRRKTERERQGRHEHRDNGGAARDSHSYSSHENARRSSMEKSWLCPNIRVRIVHKSYAGGRAFLGKGRVIDVPRAGEATVRLDNESLVLEGVKERHLETVLPAKGGKVLVVRGREKGVRGKLLTKDREKETALIQVYDDLRALKLMLDDVAEFTGMLDEDVEDMGY